jgi:hypothetical protein
MPKRNKIATVMSEYKHHKLHSGSKRGPVVKSRAQAMAIAMSEQRAYDARMRRGHHHAPGGHGIKKRMR